MTIARDMRAYYYRNIFNYTQFVIFEMQTNFLALQM